MRIDQDKSDKAFREYRATRGKPSVSATLNSDTWLSTTMHSSAKMEYKDQKDFRRLSKHSSSESSADRADPPSSHVALGETNPESPSPYQMTHTWFYR